MTYPIINIHFATGQVTLQEKERVNNTVDSKNIKSFSRNSFAYLDFFITFPPFFATSINYKIIGPIKRTFARGL